MLDSIHHAHGRRRRFRKSVWRAAIAAYRLAGRIRLEPPYRLRIKTYSPAPQQWPKGLVLSVAGIADIHFGEPYMGLDRLQTIVKTTNEAAPDVIVLLGDYGATHHDENSYPEAIRIFADAARHLSAPLGVFAIMGNHDWSDDAEARARGHGPVLASRALNAVGITVLENDAVQLHQQGQAFWLAGLGDQLARLGMMQGNDDLAGTMSKISDDAPAILLAHEPDIFPSVPARFALTLAGHTHGGQIRILGRTPYVPSRYGSRYVHGHIVEDGRHLIVSAGVGVSDLPLRLGVAPEIVMVQLGDKDCLTEESA
ncbi:MAG: uncharacterized protein QOF52_3120 [Propionibacteriaceae bacterium]|jgi:predicted MPP superfamily phosphohydrolase|nr:metallophosphoesterase [Propionibacteriaceae bacterium]MDX6323262.1 uncharacterized protein [Propionibacteriaceae bacterium]